MNTDILKLKKLRLSEIGQFSTFNFLEIDIRNIKVQDFLNYGVISSIVHLAANTGIRESSNQAKRYIENNVIGFYNMIEVASNLHVKHFIYASSSSVYGKTRNSVSDRECSSCTPKNMYAATKLMDEIIAKIFSDNNELCTSGLRFFFCIWSIWQTRYGTLDICKCY